MSDKVTKLKPDNVKECDNLRRTKDLSIFNHKLGKAKKIHGLRLMFISFWGLFLKIKLCTQVEITPSFNYYATRMTQRSGVNICQSKWIENNMKCFKLAKQTVTYIKSWNNNDNMIL